MKSFFGRLRDRQHLKKLNKEKQELIGSTPRCGDTKAASSLTSGDWTAGNTIHICGTITGTNGSPALAAQGSGSPVTLTLTNTNATSVTSIVVTKVGGNTGDFTALGTGTCSSTLAASSSCTIIV
jgi:hypothetical protein